MNFSFCNCNFTIVSISIILNIVILNWAQNLSIKNPRYNCDPNLQSANDLDDPKIFLTQNEKERLKNLKLGPEVEELAKNQTITDLWGFQHNWTNAEEGWHPFRRYQFLKNLESIKKQRKSVKKFTKLGYKVMKIPNFLYETLLDQREEKSLHIEECKVVLDVINCRKLINGEFVNSNNTKVMDFLNEKVVTRTLQSKMQKILEDWANVKLNKNGLMYGIRRYTRGSSLLQHVDKLPSHIISAILQIDQKVDKDWPLTIVDHEGNNVKVILKSGEMVLYESAVIPHGRQFPFDGDFYDNLFVHFTPEDGKIYV